MDGTAVPDRCQLLQADDVRALGDTDENIWI
jgi:hypothetical protein